MLCKRSENGQKIISNTKIVKIDRIWKIKNSLKSTEIPTVIIPYKLIHCSIYIPFRKF